MTDQKSDTPREPMAFRKVGMLEIAQPVSRIGKEFVLDREIGESAEEYAMRREALGSLFDGGLWVVDGGKKDADEATGPSLHGRSR